MSLKNILIEDFLRLLAIPGDGLNISEPDKTVKPFAALENPFDVDAMFINESHAFFNNYGLKHDDLVIGPDICKNSAYGDQIINRLSDTVLDDLKHQYRKQFVAGRHLRLIGIDLDDTLYDNTPVKDGLVKEIETVIEKCNPLVCANEVYDICKSRSTDDAQKRSNIEKLFIVKGSFGNSDPHEVINKILKTYSDFMLFKGKVPAAMFKPYGGVLEGLQSFMSNGSFIVAIITNGESFAQRDKLRFLGLQEGEHFDYILVSDDIRSAKPSNIIYEKALNIALSSVKLENAKAEILPEQCVILEDRVRNMSGADKWLKVQFLQGRHSNKLPLKSTEIPKYGIVNFKTLSIIPDFEVDKSFQEHISPYYLFKSLLLMHMLHAKEQA